MKDEDLIAEYIARHGVTRIPRGVSGECARRVGRRRHLAKIARIRDLARAGFTDRQIAERIGTTRKAVSNMRYRHNIPAGVRCKRRAA